LASGQGGGRFTPAVAEVDWDSLKRPGSVDRDLATYTRRWKLALPPEIAVARAATSAALPSSLQTLSGEVSLTALPSAILPQ